MIDGLRGEDPSPVTFFEGKIVSFSFLHLSLELLKLCRVSGRVDEWWTDRWGWMFGRMCGQMGGGIDA